MLEKLKSKKVITFGIITLLVVGLVTAGIIDYFGNVTTTFSGTRAITLTGDGCSDNDCSESIDITGGETKYTNDYILTSVSSVDIPIEISTTADEGLTETVEYQLHAEGTDPRESRIRIEARDVGLTDLNSLDTIEFEQYVSEGYTGHVDIRLEDKTLVFEYAKVNPADCDDSADYPTGSVSTFGDKGIVDSNAYAWISPGPAGPCGDGIFDAGHKSLADWKLSDGSKSIVALEFEVDSWIATTTSKMYDIRINGVLQDVVDVEAESNVDFNLKVTADNGMETGTYTVTTGIVPQ